MLPELNPEEKLVYDTIVNCNGRVTQLEICKLHPQLGCHPLHENYDNQQSTLRKIRQIIRNLRLNHKLQILSDNDGYFIKRSDEDAAKYMETLERKAKASAKSFMVTYHEMSQILGLKNQFFEQQGKLFE